MTSQLSKELKAASYIAFSSVDWEWVVHFFRIVGHSNILVPADAKPSSLPRSFRIQKCLRLPPKIVKKLKKRFDLTITTHGNDIDRFTEAERNFLLSALLEPLIHLLTPIVYIKNEYRFGSEQEGGRVESVVLSSSAILTVLVCNAANMVKGRAKLAMELYVADKVNRERGLSLNCVRGFVTSGCAYVPCHYYGGEADVSKRFWWPKAELIPNVDRETAEFDWSNVASCIWGVLIESLIDFFDASANDWQPRDGSGEPEQVIKDRKAKEKAFRDAKSAFEQFATNTFVPSLTDEIWIPEYNKLKGAIGELIGPARSMFPT
eukprot:TRINITY_DN6846_c0_g1_i1.p1 TRINITY_DN6846_c0_g1~~TRINITY_DN6846_c0_g1_i1.p1  ORF type:complete len:320 (-),score=59.69 TRINITY_DN6846_c0_g1_i1:29-988(-)